MDCLDNMLTEPLDLGSAREINGAGIMEECLLRGTRVSLPEDLLEDVSILHPKTSLDTKCRRNSASLEDMDLAMGLSFL